MRYISDDGKVFDTEQECLEHENYEKKKIEEERIKKEQFEAERKRDSKELSDLYNLLKEKHCKYIKKYGPHKTIKFSPFYEMLETLEML